MQKSDQVKLHASIFSNSLCFDLLGQGLFHTCLHCAEENADRTSDTSNYASFWKKSRQAVLEYNLQDF